MASRRLFAFAVALACTTTPVYAQQGIDYATAMRQGSDLYEKGDLPGAIQIWERLLTSLGEERAWKALYNLGLAYQSIGDPTRAVECFDGFVKKSAYESGKDIAAAREDASERVKAIRASHGAVHIVPPASGAAALVRIGSAPARPAGFTAYLAPGEHAIEVHSGTKHARKVTIRSNAGETTELVVPEAAPKPLIDEPRTLPQQQQPPPPKTEEPRGFPTGWLVGGAAVTLASGALPLVFGLRASSKRDDAVALGTGSARYAGAVGDFESARKVYYASYAVPAVLAIATAVIVVLQLPPSSARASAWSGSVEF